MELSFKIYQSTRADIMGLIIIVIVIGVRLWLYTKIRRH
jgi:hypothetical protein